MWRRVKALTDVTISSLLRRMRGDILARSPVASGEISKRRTSSESTLIVIEKPWMFHNLGFPETVFQARNSRVNDWVMHERTQCHKKARPSHTLTASLIILSLPWPDWSVKVNDGLHYRNINVYLQNLRSQWKKNLHSHLLIVPHALIDCAKRATPDKY